MNTNPDISNRGDIALIVRNFYTKAKKDELLGPIFSQKITSSEAWENHFTTMTNFWETVLFAAPNYRGNPFVKHLNLGIEKEHFNNWIQLFNETIDEHFEGEKAVEMKEKANKMRMLFELKLSMDNKSSSFRHLV